MAICWPAVLKNVGWGSAALSAVGWGATFLWRRVQHDRKLLQSIYNELVFQRTNCLNTLQKNGEQQVDVLREISGKMDFLKGFVEGSK